MAGSGVVGVLCVDLRAFLGNATCIVNGLCGRFLSCDCEWLGNRLPTVWFTRRTTKPFFPLRPWMDLVVYYI